MWVLILIAMGVNYHPTSIATIQGFHSALSCQNAGRQVTKDNNQLKYECVEVK